MDRSGGIEIFRRKFFVSECRTLSWGNPSLLCLRNFPVAKNSMDKKGGYEDYPSEILCLTLPKIFVGEHFCAVLQKNSGSEKLYG